MFAANGGAASDDKTYIEDVFSTYLYTGNGSSQTITNGIDLAGKGGMVWTKSRSDGGSNIIVDTVRGATNYVVTSATDQQVSGSMVTAFSPTGYDTGNALSVSATTYTSWTFRKAPKFFDVVTYTGTGSGATASVAHNLGSVPGFVIIKKTSGVGNWAVAARYPSAANGFIGGLSLNSTNAALGSGFWPYADKITSTTFNPANISDHEMHQMNESGQTYVAYLFAHDTTTDGLIQCGSFTTDGSGNATVTLGWEPQYVLTKSSSAVGNWQIEDNMRGMALTQSAWLQANTSVAELTSNPGYQNVVPTATGFQILSTSSTFLTNTTYIYMAIRRGPMRTPTDGTKVFSPNAFTNGSDIKITTGFVCDAQITAKRSEVSTTNSFFNTRLIGVLAPKTTYTSPSDASSYLVSSSTGAEVSSGYGNFTRGWDNTGFAVPQTLNGVPAITWNFRRAPGFFDVVCYTGTGANTMAVNHNLGVEPELIITKKRSSTGYWGTYCKYILSGDPNGVLLLNTNEASTGFNGQYLYGDGSVIINPTKTQYTVGSGITDSGDTYVSYLFASCPGVSKVGSYTGNGSSQTINCGFSAGARFLLIKRTDSAGEWYTYDTARGIVTGNDPHLGFNTNAAEVTTDDSIDPDSTGFIVNQVAAATNINANAATYIYLAIA